MLKTFFTILELRFTGYLFLNNNSLINNLRRFFLSVNKSSKIGSLGYEFLENVINNDQNNNFYSSVKSFFDHDKHNIITRGKENIKDYSIEVPEKKLIELGVINVLENCENLKTVLNDYFNGKNYKFKTFKFYRNYNFNNELMKKDIYSNFLHYDTVPFDSLKLMINYHLPTDKSGSMQFFDIIDSKKIVKNNIIERFKKLVSINADTPKFTSVFRFDDHNRLKYKRFFHDKNSQSILLWNPSMCLHGATIPSNNNYRDTLVVGVYKN
jgi:hypothetical protein